MNEGLANGAALPRPADGGFQRLRGLQTARRDGRNSGNDWIYPAFFCFDVGSFSFLLRAGNLPWVHPLFVGLEALVVGVLFNVTFEMGGRNIQGRTQAVIMLLAFAALLFKVNAVLIVLVALALGAWLIRPAAGKNGAGKPSPKGESLSP